MFSDPIKEQQYQFQIQKLCQTPTIALQHVSILLEMSIHEPENTCWLQESLDTVKQLLISKVLEGRSPPLEQVPNPCSPMSVGFGG